jgi:recombination associated protein RdgC
MWFKNLQLFKFTEKFPFTAEELAEKLAEKKFLPCKSIDAMSLGWVAPQNMDDAPLVYAANGFLLICLQKEEKLVPGSVVKQMLDDKVAEIEQKQGRYVGKNEKNTLKEDVYHQLVMRAFSKVSRHYAYIDTIDNYLVVNAASHSKAEEITVFLRNTLGSLKIEIPKVQTLTTLLTHWLTSNEYPADFAITDHCVMNNPKERGVIRCQGQNLFSEDIISLLEEGRLISQLGLSWSENLSFTIKDDFSIKSIKFLELIQDQAKDVFTETPADRFAADFTIMADSLREFIRALMREFSAQPRNEKAGKKEIEKRETEDDEDSVPLVEPPHEDSEDRVEVEQA